MVVLVWCGDMRLLIALVWFDMVEWDRMVWCVLVVVWIGVLWYGGKG